MHSTIIVSAQLLDSSKLINYRQRARFRIGRFLTRRVLHICQAPGLPSASAGISGRRGHAIGQTRHRGPSRHSRTPRLSYANLLGGNALHMFRLSMPHSTPCEKSLLSYRPRFMRVSSSGSPLGVQQASRLVSPTRSPESDLDSTSMTSVRIPCFVLLGGIATGTLFTVHRADARRRRVCNPHFRAMICSSLLCTP